MKDLPGTIPPKNLKERARQRADSRGVRMGRAGICRAQKRCPGFTVRLSDPSACGRSLCGEVLRINRLSLAIAAFQQAMGLSRRRVPTDHTLPEPESRYGLSLAHNDAFATIARSMFLACTFVSSSETLANPFDSRLLRSVRFRGRTGALSMPGTRFPRRSPTFLNHPRSPLPFRSSFENPPDQSVQPVPVSGSPPHLTPDRF